MGYAQTGSGFAPSSQFGQQAMGQMNGFGTGYPQQQQQQQQQQQGYGYGQQPYGQLPQQQQNQPYGGNSYLSQFDPYSPSNSNPSSQPGYSSTPGPNSSYYGGGAPSSANGPHPRQYVNTHKSELETWDTVSWKQALSTFESLKNAWEERKRAVEGRIRAMGGTVGGAPGLFAGGGGGMGGGYGGYGYNPQQQEIDRLNELAKEATSNIDTVAAASFQMSEVVNGYRHSGDLASKRRVRESSNAALAGLPDWPPQGF
ncbi:uncharacterized protein STEHIDRAFT_144434 [Stereum hirsutum FP-91666 SS1]|uniref:uncharacterized protein n=1 Tax=Stereum hirsutum (strain FP-91666) TaxID=721885 RepID=UPI000440CA82|nr:uncharacterized protein STEHIDRAFT_144434 [Stereum hirsutum FP-91666 SS1]EIM90944.1 hypothetical protein STEHIDRAFT_144434 [Stereum hirsutum FP-91666 SS1]